MQRTKIGQREEMKMKESQAMQVEMDNEEQESESFKLILMANPAYGEKLHDLFWSNSNLKITSVTGSNSYGGDIVVTVAESNSAKELQTEFDNTAQQAESLSKEDTPIDNGEMINELWLCKKVRTDGIDATTYFKPIQTINNTFTSMEVEELTKKADRAIKSLEQSGFIDNGGEYWKPPVHPMREKLIKALGYTDHHLSIDGLIERVAEMREELNDRILPNSSEWNNGDTLYYSDGLEVLFIGMDGKFPIVRVWSEDKDGFEWICEREHSLSKEKSPTPAQKQQKIDEQNGELFYSITTNIACDVYGHAAISYEACAIKVKEYHIKLAKQIAFKGKLESI